jgi:putative ATP-binding cassette transporter
MQAFVLAFVIIVLAVLGHFGKTRSTQAELEKAAASENELFEGLTDLLEGFKEVKLNEARGRSLVASIRRISDSVAVVKSAASETFAAQYVYSQAMFFLLLAAMVFVLPALISGLAPVITAVTAAILFIFGPLSALVASFPLFSRAAVALDQINLLEAEIESFRETPVLETLPEQPSPGDFHEIAYREIVFQYTNAEGKAAFAVGPLSMSIKRGETLMLVGGNGSGKSTLLKLITGLYYPSAGTITVDGRPLMPDDYPAHRARFSAVFTDYHLFARLYGLENVDETRVQELISLMGLEDKTSYRNGRFQVQELSTGQRKRLALIVALLEDRPIYVLDEWAADQDPQFREFFYHSLLADLKKRGKSIIAASHDDRYFHVADRILKMDLGQIVTPDKL